MKEYIEEHDVAMIKIYAPVTLTVGIYTCWDEFSPAFKDVLTKLTNHKGLRFAYSYEPSKDVQVEVRRATKKRFTQIKEALGAIPVVDLRASSGWGDDYNDIEEVQNA